MENAERYVGKQAIDATFAAVWEGYGAFARFIENEKCIKKENEDYII
ncbi:MAG: hypothetical protein ACK5U5_01680 [Burkholderiales bacterium]